jgi:hypothetical protein
MPNLLRGWNLFALDPYGDGSSVMGWAIGMFAEEVANYSDLRGMHRSGGFGFEPVSTPLLNGKLVPAVSADRQDRKAALLAKSRLLEERHRRL